MKLLLVLMMITITTALTSLFTGCGGPSAFTNGSYDNPERVELLDDKFNEADMQQMARKVIREMASCAYVAKALKPPVVALERVQNRTEEHIDTRSLTDMIRTELINTGKMHFVNRRQRAAIDREMKYQESGAVWGPSIKRRGHQIGVDYLLGGEISTNVQQEGDTKFVYYKLTMNLTNLETSEIDCTAQKQIRKKFKKHSIGL